MTEQHTPGPWRIGGHDGKSAIIYPSPTGGFQIARVRPNLDGGEANARLIAAAPELLKALETLVRGRPTTPPNHAVLGKDSVAYMNWLVFEAARAAIAKAKE